MILTLVIIILTVIYAFLFNLIPLSNWFLFLWIPCGLISSILTVVVFILIFITLCPKKNPKGKFRHFLLRDVTSIIIKIFNIKLIVVGKENIPKNNFVIYANHKSNLDPVIIYNSVHRICSAIGKKTLFKNPIMKKLQKTFGAIALDRENDREAAKSMIVAIKSVKEGLPMIIFPEGGIKSRDVEEMVNLRAGAYKLATKANALILPVSIIGTANVTKKGFFKRKTVKIIYHNPITPEEYAGMNTTIIGHMVEDIINSGIKNG
ncbi:MAG: lysophospholipid acyltransferase family protein [Anaeroplasma sp.]